MQITILPWKVRRLFSVSEFWGPSENQISLKIRFCFPKQNLLNCVLQTYKRKEEWLSSRFRKQNIKKMSSIPDHPSKVSLYSVFGSIVNPFSPGSWVSSLVKPSASQLRRVLEILTWVTVTVWKLSKERPFIRLYLRVYCLKCQSIEVPGKVLFNETLRLSFVQDIKSGLYLITSPQGSVSLKQKPFTNNEDLECLWLIYHS